MSSTMPCNSSGLCLCSAGASRRVLERVGGGSISLRLNACGPRRPEATPNSTRCPALSPSTPAGNADERTYTSSPSSCDRKPNPLSASYHLTLPVGTGLTCLSNGSLGWTTQQAPRLRRARCGFRSYSDGCPASTPDYCLLGRLGGRWRRYAPDSEHYLACIRRPLDGRRIPGGSAHQLLAHHHHPLWLRIAAHRLVRAMAVRPDDRRKAHRRDWRPYRKHHLDTAVRDMAGHRS